MPNINKVVYGNNTLIDLTGTTATADKIMEGYGAFGRDGVWMDGSIPNVAGGTPVATKSNVTNHSIDVTPSVTNSSGYVTGSTITGTAVTVSASELVSGTLEATTNNNTYDVTNYASVDVEIPDAIWDEPSISYSGRSGTFRYSRSLTSAGYEDSGFGDSFSPSSVSGLTLINTNTHITPTESSQLIASDGVMVAGGQITVDAIPSTYVGSGITQRDSTDLTVSGATVTVPAGYYADEETKSVAMGSATTPTTTITANPSISVSNSGLITASVSASQGIAPDVNAGYISTGTAGTVTASGSNTQQLTTQGATTITPTESSQTAVAVGKYTTGAVTVAAIPSDYVGSGIDQRDETDLTASGATVTVPSGYYAEQETKTIDSGALNSNITYNSNHPALMNAIATVNPAGYIDSSKNISRQIVIADVLPTQSATTITPTESEQTAVSQYKWTTGEVKVGAISSTYVGSGIDQRDGDDLTASGATVSVPAGYYAEAASKSVASGTAGTPTATKGTVSNHSVSVTPSVTNTTGYITGSTKTGTAVTVSASELVSGTLTIDSSGTKDVTNYASASVNAGTATNSGTASVGGATVTAGTNSITLSKSVPITPDVTAGYISSGTSGNVSVSLTGSVTTKGATTYTPTTTNQTIAGNTYLTGTQTITGDADLVASNIKKDVNIFGITGTYESNNDFVITLSKNQSGEWEPDCTYAEAKAAYDANKNVVSVASDGYTATLIDKMVIDDEFNNIYYAVSENYDYNQGGLYAWGHNIKGYNWTSSGIEVDENSIEYNTSTATATTSDVVSGKRFFNADGIQVGTYAPNLITKTVTPQKTTQIVTPDVIDETTIISQALSSYGGSHQVTSGGSWYTDVTLASGQGSRFTSFPMSIHLYISFRSEAIISGGNTHMRGADTKIDRTVTLPSENYSVEIPVSSTYIKKIVLEPYSSNNRKPRIRIYDPDTFSTSNFYVYIRNADVSFPQYGWSSAPYDNAFRIYPAEQYDGLSQVTVNGDADLIASNIKSGVEIFGVTGTYQADTGAVADEITQLQGGGDWHNVYGVDLTLDTVTADKLLTGYTAHDSAGNAITGTYSGGGGSGLEYEEGTWTPSTDTERELISFTNTHTGLPIFVMLTDATGTDDQTSSTNYSFSYTGYYNYSGEASPSTLTSNCRYGQVNYVYRGTGNPSGGTINISSLTGGSTYDQDYYVSNTGFYPYTNSTSRYWRTTRTYKWIAVWGM